MYRSLGSVEWLRDCVTVSECDNTKLVRACMERMDRRVASSSQSALLS